MQLAGLAGDLDHAKGEARQKVDRLEGRLKELELQQQKLQQQLTEATRQVETLQSDKDRVEQELQSARAEAIQKKQKSETVE